MAMTLRLWPALEAEAQRYADSLGISFNALISVALRDYLDARPAPSAQALQRPGLPPDPPAPPPGKLSPADRLKRNAQAKRAGGGK